MKSIEQFSAFFLGSICERISELGRMFLDPFIYLSCMRVQMVNTQRFHILSGKS